MTSAQNINLTLNQQNTVTPGRYYYIQFMMHKDSEMIYNLCFNIAANINWHHYIYIARRDGFFCIYFVSVWLSLIMFHSFPLKDLIWTSSSWASFKWMKSIDEKIYFAISSIYCTIIWMTTQYFFMGENWGDHICWNPQGMYSTSHYVFNYIYCTVHQCQGYGWRCPQ